MQECEKYLLLEVLMIDLRMRWGRAAVYHSSWYNKIEWYFYNRKRIRAARRLANELLLFAVIGRLEHFKVGDDGRWLRASWESGGYEGMDVFHNQTQRVERWDNGMENTRYVATGLSAEFLRQCKRLIKMPFDFYFCEDGK